MAPEISTPGGKPTWLRQRLPSGPGYHQTRHLLKQSGLHTVCQEARCPNMFECFDQHTATFLILGDRCTRNCTFCAVTHGPPLAVDGHEPERVARAVQQMGLTYVVITSVTRDDLADGGAAVFAATITAIRSVAPGVQIEVLIPDFKGDPAALQTVLAARPDVLNHNLETVPRLYPRVRPQAEYGRSLKLLERAAAGAAVVTKTGLMLGLGERDDEIRKVLEDLRTVQCRILTLGQYLRPTPAHHPVNRYVEPDQFREWRKTALALGFAAAVSSPLTRSSYHARETLKMMPSAVGDS